MTTENNGDKVLGGLRVGLIPGTGRMGSGLARRFAEAGIPVFIGSRDASKALRTSSLISASSPSASPCLQGAGSNAEAAAWANLVVWSPMGPLEERETLLRSLAPFLENKIIIDVSNVMSLLDETKWGQTSSVLLNQKALGVPARWTTAFKATFARLLQDLPDKNNPHSTFVVGDDEEAIATTIALVDAIPGFKGVKAGNLTKSKIIELFVPWVIELDDANHGGQHLSGYRYGM